MEEDDDPDEDPLGCTTENILKMFTKSKLSCNLRVLGSQLGLDSAHLDEIESLPYGQRRIQIVEKCSHIQSLSWALLVTILRGPALKEYSVAEYIEQHCLPRESMASDCSYTQQLSFSRSLSMSTSSPETSLTYYSADSVMTIPNVVNEIADVSNWQELGSFLGLDAVDIERIASNYEPREHHQRLVETWFAREPQRLWEKLHRAMEEAAARRGSLTSQPGSVPSTPTSPMDIDGRESGASHHSTLQLPTVTSTSSADIETQIEEFEKRFTDIQIATRKELEKREDAVDLVKDELTAMPLKEHSKIISAIAKRRKQFNNLTEFFTHLTLHCWNFFEYHPLKQLILNTCSERLKVKIKVYARDIERFQQQTTITEFLKYRRHLAKTRPIPERFKRLTNEHNIDPDFYTLADLESFRLDTCQHVKLSDFALQVYKITSKCILVEWLVPEEVVELLCLFYSSKEGEELLQKHGVEKVSIEGGTLQSWLLLCCVKAGECERAQSILDEEYADLDLNCQDVECGRTSLFHAAVRKYTDLLRKLLERGADVNIQDNEGKTVLMAAVECKHVEVIKTLLNPEYQHLCDINLQEHVHGWSALHFAAASGQTDIVELLNDPILHTNVSLTDNV